VLTRLVATSIMRERFRAAALAADAASRVVWPCLTGDHRATPEDLTPGKIISQDDFHYGGTLPRTTASGPYVHT